jgi:hypothetical protein
MNPIIARWGIRGIDDFTVEELARLQQKLEGWIRQRAPKTERTRRRPWLVMKPKTAHPAKERRRRVSHGGLGKETT